MKDNNKKPRRMYGGRMKTEDQIDHIKRKSAIHYIENREHRLTAMKAYRESNPIKPTDESRKKERERYRSDEQYRLKEILKSRMQTATNAIKSARCAGTIDLLGCSVIEARHHLESQFTDGMTWENHSLNGWHIDHIKPCASFDLTIDSEQKQCFHYSNLQPLWAEDNLRKGNKYDK